MSDYQKIVVTGGKYADKKELYRLGADGKRAKIVSETNDEPSQTFKDKNGNPQIQHVCKVQFEVSPEAVKTNLNQATINALVEAFGSSSKLWMNKYLTVLLKKESGGKYPLFLIPEGFVAAEDDNEYTIIVREGGDASAEAVPPLNDEPEITAAQIPF